LIEVGNVRVAPACVRIQFSRASGPGGQNVNKVNSRCEVWLKVGDIVGMTLSAQSRLRTMAGSRLTLADEIHLDAHENRSQEQNRAAAIERLRELIVHAMIEPKKRKKTRPSYGSKQRRLECKKRRSDIKKGRSGGFE
jgi:ribosome-associated protein